MLLALHVCGSLRYDIHSYFARISLGLGEGGKEHFTNLEIDRIRLTGMSTCCGYGIHLLMGLSAQYLVKTRHKFLDSRSWWVSPVECYIPTFIVLSSLTCFPCGNDLLPFICELFVPGRQTVARRSFRNQAC